MSAPDDPTLLISEAVPEVLIGPYQVLRKLGEGGMGVVYHASQHQPIRRQVALKIIKPGMDSREVIARFESERQALAMMDHPNIARVFDAGATPAGRPYFVMELVNGVPITYYSDSNRLTLNQRLELFIPVCHAIQHAHQKGIIHRDIKPSNILVAVQEGEPSPKVIDFGLAKALGNQLSDATIMTNVGSVIGTLNYMSPEQAELTRQDIDTRSDVYSLGAVLYELLTGTTPIERERLAEAGYIEALQRIRTEEPDRPSVRLRHSDSSTEVAEQRRSDQAALPKLLNGELDWIVMKAIEKDRARRYNTPLDLAADIRRYLNNEPVLACSPSPAYGARKFVRRHRFGVAVAASAVLLLIMFSVTMALQARRIAQERDRANQEAQASQRVTEFLTGLFHVSDPSEARGNSVTAREILDKGADRIVQDLKTQPLVQARLMDTIGDVYQNLGLYDRATPLLENALTIRRLMLGNEHLDTATSLEHLGYLDFLKGDLPTSEKLVREALAIRRKLLGNENLAVAGNLEMLGQILRAEETPQDVDEAERVYRESLATRRKLLGGDHPAIAQGLNNLGMVLYANRGNYAAAEPLLREAVAMNERLLGENDQEVAATINNLALLLRDKGEYAEAEKLLRRAIAIRLKTLGGRHPSVAISVNNLARVLQYEGNFQAAEVEYVRAIELYRNVFPANHWEIATIQSLLGSCLTQERRFRDAEPLLLESYPIIRANFGDSHNRTRIALKRIVDLYNAWGQPQESARYAAMPVK